MFYSGLSYRISRLATSRFLLVVPRGLRRSLPIYWARMRSFEFFVEDARRHEDQQLGLRIALLRVTEQRTDAGQVAEERHLGDRGLLVELVDAAEHHGLAVV